MKETYYDIEIRLGKGPWQIARLYGDYIYFEGNKIFREDIVSFRISLFPKGYKVTTRKGEIFYVRGNRALSFWYNEIRPLRIYLSWIFFLLAMLLGLWRPGISLWPVVLLYAFFSGILGYFFHWALEKNFKTFSGFLALYFLLLGLPLSLSIPPLVWFFFIGSLILVILFYLWNKKKGLKKVHPFFPIVVWSFVTILNHHYLLFFSKKFLDYNYQKAFGEDSLLCNSERCLLGEQVWKVPPGFEIEQNNFFKSWLYDDITFFFGFLKIKYLLKTPPEGRYGFLSEAPAYYTGKNFFSFTHEYLKKNQNFYWALYLSSSPQYAQNDILWKTFAFFNPNKLKVEEILLVYIPGFQNLGWVFCLILPENSSVEYILSRILEGFLKQKDFP